MKRRSRPVEETQVEKGTIASPALAGGGKLEPASYPYPGLLDEEEDETKLVPKPKVEKAIENRPDQVFVCARLPQDVRDALTAHAKRIAEEKSLEAEDVDHVTVLFVPGADQAIPEERIAKLAGRARGAFSGLLPLEVRVQGWAYFDGASKGGEPKTALVALLDAPGLAEVHLALKAAARDEGFPADDQTHGFVPHATIAYLDKGDRVEELPELGLEFKVGELELVHAKNHPLPLGESIEKRAGLWGSTAGKARLAGRIVSMIPAHKVYVEPFAGGAAAFYAKEPSEKEVLSDTNPEVAHAFKFTRDATKAQVAELQGFDWTATKENAQKIHELAPKTAAERFFRFAWKRWAMFFRNENRITAISPDKIGKRCTVPDRIEKAKERLRGVVVRNDSYQKILQEFDSPETFFYLDPPYPSIAQEVGEKAFSEDDFVAALKGIKGKFLLHYEAQAKKKFDAVKGWTTALVDTHYTPGGSGGGRYEAKILEVRNYPLPVKREKAAPVRRDLTAIHRDSFSAPVKRLLQDGLIKSGDSFLDYGSGHGDDVKRLRAKGITAAGWDPVFSPDAPRKSADVVNLGFVLNVIEDQGERAAALRSAFRLAKRVLVVAVRPKSEAEGGKAFGDGVITGRDTFQKFYSQDELLGYMKKTLGVEPVSAGAGIAYAFKTDQAREEHVQKAQDAQEALRLRPGMPVDAHSTGWLLKAHADLHRLFSFEATGVAVVKGWDVEGLVDLHARVVDTLAERGAGHPAPPDGGLDDVSGTFEAAVEKSSEAPAEALEEAVELEKLADPYLQVPDEDARLRFVAQNHWRGKSLHSDLRIELGARDLVGWTLNTQVEGGVKDPVTTLAQARRLAREDGRVSKIDWSSGRWSQDQLLAEPKGLVPHRWLEVEGTTARPPGGDAPPVGGTRNFPGVFQIADRGQAEFGAQTPDLHEYFLHGRALSGRVIFRKVDGRWLAMKPKEETPYVLQEGTSWLPPRGVSALPRALRAQVPEKFRYWLEDGEARTDARDALRAAIKAGEVTLKAEAVEKEAQGGTFVLQKQETTQGALWAVCLDLGDQVVALKTDVDPVSGGAVIFAAENVDRDALTFEGDVRPGHYLSLTKGEGTRISILDKGSLEVVESADSSVKVDLKSDAIRCSLEVTKNDREWLFATSEPGPVAKGESARVELNLPITKIDREKRLVTGVVLEPEEVDAHGDWERKETIERTAHNFLARYNAATRLGLMHKIFGVDVELVESWIERSDTTINGKPVKAGSWLITVRVNDLVLWSKIKRGLITGFSIGGIATVKAAA